MIFNNLPRVPGVGPCPGLGLPLPVIEQVLATTLLVNPQFHIASSEVVALLARAHTKVSRAYQPQ